MNEKSAKETLILDLFSINAIKFGEFKLKSGIISPYYFDLRVLVSYPYLLELTADVFWQTLRLLYFDVVVGVPYSAIPIATSIGVKHNQNMIFVRKERKDYGTKKLIEGEFHEGQKAVVIDDVITNGESKIMAIKPLEESGLTVKDIVVLLDRGQGGPSLLKKQGYNCHCILTIDEVFRTLLKHKRVDPKMIQKCTAFAKKTRSDFLKKDKKN